MRSGTYYTRKGAIGNMLVCETCMKRVSCLGGHTCKMPWHRRWVWRLLETQKFSILQGSNAHRTLAFLDRFGEVPLRDIRFSNTHLYVLQLLVGGLIARSRLEGRGGTYRITELGIRALRILNGTDKFFHAYRDYTGNGCIRGTGVIRIGNMRPKFIQVEYELNLYWVERAKKVHW